MSSAFPWDQPLLPGEKNISQHKFFTSLVKIESNTVTEQLSDRVPGVSPGKGHSVWCTCSKQSWPLIYWRNVSTDQLCEFPCPVKKGASTGRDPRFASRALSFLLQPVSPILPCPSWCHTLAQGFFTGTGLNASFRRFSYLLSQATGGDESTISPAELFSYPVTSLLRRCLWFQDESCCFCSILVRKVWMPPASRQLFYVSVQSRQILSLPPLCHDKYFFLFKSYSISLAAQLWLLLAALFWNPSAIFMSFMVMDVAQKLIPLDKMRKWGRVCSCGDRIWIKMFFGYSLSWLRLGRWLDQTWHPIQPHFLCPYTTMLV